MRTLDPFTLTSFDVFLQEYIDRVATRGRILEGEHISNKKPQEEKRVKNPTAIPMPKQVLSIFNRLRNEQTKLAFQDYLNYISTLAEDMGEEKNTALIEATMIYFAENYKTMSKKDINKFFYKKSIPKGKEIIPPPNEEFKKQFENITFFQSNISQDDLYYYKQDAAAGLRRFTENLGYVGKAKYKTKHEFKEKLIEEFEVINNNPEFKNIYFDSGLMTFNAVTAFPVIIEDVNFGFFHIVYDVENNHINVYPFAENLSNQNNSDDLDESIQAYHPHVFENGTVCFGTATAVIEECLIDYKIAQIFDLTNIILRSYSENDAITNITRFTDSFSFNGELDFSRNYLHKDLPRKEDTKIKAA